MYLPYQQRADELNYRGKFPGRVDIAEKESESVAEITTAALLNAFD